MVIRRYNGSKRDIQGIILVDHLGFNEDKMDEKWVVQTAAKKGNVIFVAEEDEIIGFVSLMEAHTLHGFGLWIDLLVVLPAEQNKGVATKLVHAALDYADHLGADYKSALVRSNNRASLTVLQNLGYKKEPDSFELLMKD